MSIEQDDITVDPEVLADDGRTSLVVEMLKKGWNPYRKADLEQFSDRVTVTEGTREIDLSYPPNGRTITLNYRQIEFPISQEEVESAPKELQGLFARIGIEPRDQVNIVLKLDHEGSQYSWGIVPGDVTTNRIGVAFRYPGYEIIAPCETLESRYREDRWKDPEYEMRTKDDYEVHHSSNIPIVDRFRKTYGGSGNREGYKLRDASLIVGTKWVKRLLEERLEKPIDDPTISPVEIVEKLKSSERYVQIGYPRKDQKPIYFGALTGRDYYELLFEMWDIPKVELLTMMQRVYHSLPGEDPDMLVVAMTIKFPDDIKTLSEAMSVMGPSKKSETITTLEAMDTEQRQAILARLREYDVEQEDQLENKEKVLQNESVEDPTLRALQEAVEKKWKKIRQYQ